KPGLVVGALRIGLTPFHRHRLMGDPPPFLGSKVIPAQVGGDGEEPGPDVRVRAERAIGAICPQERLLRQILRLGRAGGHTTQIAIDLRVMRAHDCLERLFTHQHPRHRRSPVVKRRRGSAHDKVSAIEQRLDEERRVTDTADVVVVGGGVNGVSIAYALAARGVGNVVLCEQAALANGASGRSSALVRMHYTNEWDARLAFASFPIFRHWPEIMGGPPVFTHTGFVNVVAPQYADALGKNVAMLRGIGVNTVALAPGELRDLQPFAHIDDIGAAAWEPDSGYADPARTVDGLARRAAELGARILQWTPVRKILTTESRAVGVETSAGRIDAGAVVVAAGAWAPRICREIGVELPARPKG